MRQKNPVGRPKRCRRINHDPAITYFKPAGIPVSMLEEIQLTIDELETIRLADLKGLYQDEAAKYMQISRQTFGRILTSAHTKIAEALIHGKFIKIKGGNVSISGLRKFHCSACNHTWEEPFGTGRPNTCPSCKMANFHRIGNQQDFHHKKHFREKHHRVRATHVKDES